VIATVKDYLHSGYGVAVRIYSSNNHRASGHALTVWGYRYDIDETVTGLWVTDSDDGKTELRLLPVAYQRNWISDELRWRVADERKAAPYQGWLIEGVQALKPRDLQFLRVHKAGTGTGRVMSTPAGIACGDDCILLSQEQKTVVRLTAFPAKGSIFTGWAGECQGSDACVVTIDGEQHAIAIFDDLPKPSLKTVRMTIHTDTGVHVYPPGDVHEIAVRTDATFVFTTDERYQIYDVLVDGISVGGVTTYTFKDVTADHLLEIRTQEKLPKTAGARVAPAVKVIFM
jgi:hypothetical protein